MKRKADTDVNVEDGMPLFKSLRKSISEFIHANDASELSLTKRRVVKNKDCSTQSIHSNSFFFKMKMTLLSCVLLIYMWSKNFTNGQIAEEWTHLTEMNSIELLAQDPEDERWAKYRERLATFPTMVKLSGAKEISPAVCASHGWQYHDGNFLQCADCRRVLCVSLPEAPAISIRIMRSCIRNIQRKLNESHALNCRWRTNSGLNLVAPPYNIRRRYEALMRAPLSAVPLAADVVDVYALAAFPTLVDRFRLVVAVCGWLPAADTSTDRLNCLLCGRELCLDVFTEERPLNPLDQHYAYCPVADKEFPIWREAVNAAMPPTKKENEPLVSQLSRVKSMLGYIFKK